MDPETLIRSLDILTSRSAALISLSGYPDKDINTAAGLMDKARFVLGELTRRIAGLGMGGVVPQVVQVYSVHGVHDVVAGPVATGFAPNRVVTWYPAKPPVTGLKFEMDCRTVSVERLEVV